MAEIEVEGARLHLGTEGTSGPPVLLIQGVGVRGLGWRPQIEGLSHAVRLAWFDHRGIGGSTGEPTSVAQMADDALAVLDHLGWPDAHLVGHSLGGAVAQEVALRCPERIRSLSLLCTFARGASAVQLSPTSLMAQLRTRLGTRWMRRRAFFRLVTHPSLHSGSRADERLQHLEEVFGRELCDLPPVALAQVQALTRFDRTASLSTLGAIPSLVISGSEDRIAPPSEGRALAEALKTELIVLEGGHALVVFQADTINEHLAILWARTDGRSRTLRGDVR